eukprot:1744072-Rhodomonas_salina.4
MGHCAIKCKKQHSRQRVTGRCCYSTTCSAILTKPFLFVEIVRSYSLGRASSASAAPSSSSSRRGIHTRSVPDIP